MNLQTPEGPAITVSIARTGAERAACFALRYRVYFEELACPLPAADHQRKLERAAEDETAVLFSARAAGELIGTVRIHHGAAMGIPRCFEEACDLPRFLAETPVTQMAAVGRLAIDPRYRGGNAIVVLFRESCRIVMEEHPETSLLFILPMDNPRLVAVYQMLGFRPVDTERRYVMDTGPSLPMFKRIPAGGR